MKTSPEIDQVMQAIANLQSELKPVYKDTYGYNYKYASFENIITHVRPLLTEHGLMCIQSAGTPEFWPAIALTTRFVHVPSGQWIEDTLTMPMPEDASNPFQAAGSGITYAKRYMFSAMLGVIDSKDADGTYSEKKAIPTIQEMQQQNPKLVLEALKVTDGSQQEVYNYVKANS